ncbi:hypothetical protein WMF39_24940 [Sorangium sp. So ce1504]|uniref:hypothetical protein n=1 Tax=Sorangium sp. So ce1504 TaxID=3133337 RepID=UPI003F640F44
MSDAPIATLRGHAVSSRVLTPPPAQNLDDAVRLCDPYSPLDPREDSSLFANLTAIRGSDRLGRIVRNIRRSGGIPTLHFVSGHLGSGKTTELVRMKVQLETAAHGAPLATVLFLDADVMLNRTDIDLEDILLALWKLVYEQRKAAAAKVLMPLWKDQIKDALSKTNTNLPGDISEALTRILGEVRLPSAERRKDIRTALRPTTAVLIEGLNKAFAATREAPDDGAGPLVVLIDNMEKLSQADHEGVERLYRERMGALKSLDAHLVITVPLYLCYAPAGAGLSGLYGGEIVVVPVIEVRRRAAEGGGDNQGGVTALADLLKKRVRFDRLFEEGDRAAERIARLSGGCIRHALHMVRAASNEHDDPPVTAASVERAAAILQADFERALPEGYVPILRQIAETNRFPDQCEVGVKRDLLLNLFVLEYQNGGPDPWHAVHPLVERCRKYREHG